MRTITRDIVITLTVKAFLLFFLWWICYKDIPKVIIQSQHFVPKGNVI